MSEGEAHSTKDYSKALRVLQRQKLRVNFNLDGTVYQALENIGTGAYGVVCSATNTISGSKVAIKKIPHAFTNSTVAKRTLREIKVLLHFDHENIIAIKDMLYRESSFGGDVYIVLDLMETDLHQIIHSKQQLTNQHVQYFLYQILRGLKYIHSANIIHRDLKPSNLMVNSDCLLKIGDFGMARSLACPTDPNDPNAPAAQFMTQYVATRWYRAPELLFSMLDYSTAVDMWSVGCIFAEMLMRRQLFPGKDHLSQLKLIVYYLGTPPSDVMAKISSDIVRRIIHGIGKQTPLAWHTIVPKATTNAVDLLARMMRLAPWERISAENSLRHAYLDEYHDPPFEQNCDRVFTFDHDIDSLPRDALHVEIVRAIDAVHGLSLRSLSADPPPVPEGVRAPVPADLSTHVRMDIEQRRAMEKAVKHGKKKEPKEVNDGGDVEMLSAKFDESMTLGVAAVVEPTAVDPRTKLRSLLEAKSRAAAAEGAVAPTETMTAQARYQERVEKRRRKLERREEKARRETGEVQVRLTDQDQSLLQRWSRMQQERQRLPATPVPIDDYFGGDEATSNVRTREYAQPMADCTLAPEATGFATQSVTMSADAFADELLAYRQMPSRMAAFSITGDAVAPYTIIDFSHKTLEEQPEKTEKRSDDGGSEFESQLGDIISQALPSRAAEFGSASGGSVDDEAQIKQLSSAQLMEDWIAAVRAAECKPEDIDLFAREIRRDLV